MTDADGLALEPESDQRYVNLTWTDQGMDNLTWRLFSDGNSSMAEHPSQPVRALTLLSIILGVASIILNIIFLIVMRFLKDRSTAYHLLMQNLSVADMMASLLFLLARHFPSGPFAHMTLADNFMLHEGLPYVFRALPWMFFTGYLLTLTCLTVHQYVAVCKPWKYSEFGTKKKIWVSLLLVWLTSSLQIIVPLVVLFGLSALSDKVAAKRAMYEVSRIEMLIWMIIFAITTVFNIALDVIIYKKIKKLKLKRRNHLPNQETQNIQMKHEAFITVTLLLLASIFCRLPFPLFSIVGLELEVAEAIDHETANLINTIIVLLLFINFFGDPIVYVLRMKEVKKVLKSIFNACVPCSRKTSRGDHVGRNRLLSTHRTEITQTMMTDMGGGAAARKGSQCDRTLIDKSLQEEEGDVETEE